MKIGILALQGSVEAHEKKLQELQVDSKQIRQASDLDGINGLIIPGGESTTLIHLLKINQLWDPLINFSKSSPLFGTCAGAILIAKSVIGTKQPTLNLMDVQIARNAYGRQIDSFISLIYPAPSWHSKDPIEGVFIRAPKVIEFGPHVQPLFRLAEDCVLLQQDHYLISTFHPELTSNNVIHRYFINLCLDSKKKVKS